MWEKGPAAGGEAGYSEHFEGFLSAVRLFGVYGAEMVSLNGSWVVQTWLADIAPYSAWV